MGDLTCLFFRITSHARERYITRILNPEKYHHLSVCGSYCDECNSLFIDLHNQVNSTARWVDKEIIRKIRYAADNNQTVKDIKFNKVLERSNNLRGATYFYYENVIFAVRNGMIITVLPNDMIDGTTILLTPKYLERNLFKSWKREAKFRSLYNV